MLKHLNTELLLFTIAAGEFSKTRKGLKGFKNCTSIYRVQSKIVRRPFSLQPLVADVYFQLQNWFKKCKDLCYGVFKFQKSIL